MRWQYGLVGGAGVILLFMACSSGADPIEDDGSSFTGGGGKPPDVTALCEEQCAPLHAAGETDYRASRSCILCDACYTICKAEGVDVGSCSDDLEAPNGCSALHATCAECVTGTCAQYQDPATTAFTGVCATQGETCAANNECVGMTNCVGSCVANSSTM